MKKKYGLKFFGMATLMVFAICLAGCTVNAEDPEEKLVATVTAVADTAVLETTQIDSVAAPAPQHFVETVNEDFHIDATVEEYPADGLAGVYIGEKKRFTKEEINSFFNFCGTAIDSSNESSTGDMDYYNGVCENGFVFFSEQSSHNHPYSKFIYRNDQKSQIYRDYPIYNDEQEYLTNAKYTVGWMFIEPKAFSFATKAEAEQNVRDALAALGLSNLKLLRTLYCDHQTLEAAMDRVTTNEDYGPIGVTVENNGYPIRDDWSEDDDAYMFSFGISVHGVPMSYRYDTSEETAWYTGSNVVVWYTKDGIVSLSVDTPWEVGEVETPPEPIISAQTALEAAKTKFGYNLMDRDKRIEEIRLEYHYIQDRERWLLKPVWAVALSYTDETHFDRYYSFMNIDALTGDEL